MKVLLIEDEVAHCDKYKNCAENLPYSVELSVSHGLKKAVKFIEDKPFDVILLDLELNESDGDGVAFLQWLKTSGLKDRPFIIVITNNRSKATHNAVRNLGADYIFMKAKPDYSPRLVFDFAENILRSQPAEEREPSATLEDIIAKEVEKIGFNHDVIGTEYLIQAVAVVLHAGKPKISLDKDIYPVLGKRFKKTDWSVARAIRTAIVRTWRMTDLDTLAENYTCNVDYDMGYPTNKQMILYIADKVKRDSGCSPTLTVKLHPALQLA
jgi:CheY-like chemotaxis protein